MALILTLWFATAATVTVIVQQDEKEKPPEQDTKIIRPLPKSPVDGKRKAKQYIVNGKRVIISN